MRFPAMRTPALSTVYVDDQCIGLMGDPMPPVAKILAVVGHPPDTVVVRRCGARTGIPSTRLRQDDVIDRTADPAKPIYLCCTARGAAAAGLA